MQDFALPTGASIIGESERLKIGVDPKLGPNDQVRRTRTGGYDGVQGLIREGTGCVDEDGQVRRGARTGRCGVRRGAHGESWEVTGAAPRPPPLVSAQKIQIKTLFSSNQRCIICGEARWVRWLLASKGTKSLVFTNRYKYEHKYNLEKKFGIWQPPTLCHTI